MKPLTQSLPDDLELAEFKAALSEFLDTEEGKDTVRELVTSVSLLAGFCVNRRRLRKRGAPEWVVYLGPALLLGMGRIAHELTMVKAELQRQRAEAKVPVNRSFARPSGNPSLN